jgi:hypothetical protein
MIGCCPPRLGLPYSRRISWRSNWTQGYTIVVVNGTSRVLPFALCALSASTQGLEGRKWIAKTPPQFQAFPVTESWHGTAAAVKLTTRSDRMFKTNLTNASKKPPNFAGHYRIAYWGCGSACAAGALVDLQTGRCISPAVSKTQPKRVGEVDHVSYAYLRGSGE